MPSLETVDEEQTDLGYTDTDYAINMGWNGAGGGCSGSYACGCGWCSGSSRARINPGWGSGAEESGCGRRRDGSGWVKTAQVAGLPPG